MDTELTPRKTRGATVTRTGEAWRLEIPAGGRGAYRLAQLDDYAALPRRRFRHAPPWTLNLRARVSAEDLPGTWGFGLWNDPFGFSLGFGGTAGRLPALPNAAWFFYGSQPNWLSLHEGVPAHGFFAGMLRSQCLPSVLLAAGVLALPLLAIRPLSRLLRRLAGAMVRQEGAALAVDVTQWHQYSLEWLHEEATFKLDGREVLHTALVPHPPLGLVLWIDNQYAAWRPDGRLGYGTLENQAAWLEVQV
jgi:hypothetical protein